MSATTRDSASDLEKNELRLDRLLGRRVLGRNNESIGHLEEFRAEKHGSGATITGYVIGRAGLVERLGVGVRLLLGQPKASGWFARWDQLDISNPDRPTLTCTTDDLQKL